MSSKRSVRKDFSHDICNLTTGINVCKIDNILFAPVSDDVVFHVYMFGSFGGHVVR